MSEYYGLNGPRKKDREIAKILSPEKPISNPRVRQIRTRELEKLREAVGKSGFLNKINLFFFDE